MNSPRLSETLVLDIISGLLPPRHRVRIKAETRTAPAAHGVVAIIGFWTAPHNWRNSDRAGCGYTMRFCASSLSSVSARDREPVVGIRVRSSDVGYCP